jgi:hypothetical protein
VECEQRDETGDRRGGLRTKSCHETGKRTGGLRTERRIRKQNRWIANREMRQEIEEEDCEQRVVTRQEREQEDFKHRDVSEDRKKNGECLKECAGDFVVFTYESRIFAGRIAEVKKRGSLIKPCNMCS